MNHLADTVENWGPFWAHSAFPFESWNKKIIDKVTSANSRPLQIGTRYLMYRFIEGLIDDLRVSQTTNNTIRSTLRDGLMITDITADYAQAPSKFRGIGKVENRPPCGWEYQALRTAGYRTEVASFYEHAVIQNINYRCREETGKRRT